VKTGPISLKKKGTGESRQKRGTRQSNPIKRAKQAGLSVLLTWKKEKANSGVRTEKSGKRGKKG